MNERIDRYMRSVKRLWFAQRYDKPESREILDSKRDALGLTIDETADIESKVVTSLKKALSFLNSFDVDDSDADYLREEFVELCADLGLTEEEASQIQAMHKGAVSVVKNSTDEAAHDLGHILPKRIPLEKNGIPQEDENEASQQHIQIQDSSGLSKRVQRQQRRKSKIGYLILFVILFGVAYLYASYEVTWDIQGMTHFSKKPSISTELGLFKEVRSGSQVICKHCQKTISDNISMLRVPIWKAKDYHTYTNSDYCDSCGRQQVSYTVTYQCERCLKKYRTEVLSATRREEVSDITKKELCSPSCPGIPYAVKYRCKQCGNLYSTGTRYVYASENSKPNDQTVTEGFCSDKCRTAAKIDATIDKVSEKTGDVIGRTARGIFEGIKKHAP